MAHLSRKDLENMIQIATNGYEAGIQVERNIPFLDAYKTAHLHQKPLDVAYDAFVAFGIYDAAAKLSGEEADPKKKLNVFIETLREGLKKEFAIEDAAFAVVDEIDQKLKELNSIWNIFNWFKQENRTNIAVLKTIKDTLLTRQTGYIREAIEAHDVGVSESMADFFGDLKSKYGAESLELRGETSRVLKQNLSQPFRNYITSRTSLLQRLITKLFRIPELSEKKLNVAQVVIEDIQDCSGSYEDVMGVLKADQEGHALLSTRFEPSPKPHYNLREPRRELIGPPQSSSTQNEPSDNYAKNAYYYFGQFIARKADVREGEISTRSELADAFHEAIEMKLQ